MRLTDEQVKAIRRDNDDPTVLRGVMFFKNNIAALLADREALLAENAKLRKVVEAAENALLYARDLRNPYEADQLKRALAVLETKEPTDDKQRR